MINIDLDKIKPYKNNAKKHTAEQIKKVSESIKRFGFVQPIVIDKNNEIIIGHCRYEASKVLGLKVVPCIMVDKLSDEEIKALRLADNKLNESEWDMGLVLEELEDLDIGLVELTGFDVDELSDINFDDIESNENREKKYKDQTVTCPGCGNNFIIKI